MKHLIIYAHPNKESLNHTIKEKVLEQLTRSNHKVEVRDLYQLGFAPIVTIDDMNGWRTGQVSSDVAKEQEYILWADVITFIYPIWWAGLPAMIKGYIDRVLSYGFAFKYTQGVQQGLLKGKKAVIINTQGKSLEEYESIGMNKALKLTSDKCIFEYCGFSIEDHIFFGNANGADTAMVQKWLKEVKNIKSYM
jgi:NAD(P)H dehydrogenase (quinone)